MDEVKMMVSCVVIKDYRKIVRVSFLRGRDYAEGILPDGIVHAAEKQPDADQEPIAPREETAIGDKRQLYRVQVGAYAVKGNADATLAKLKAAGFDAIIVNA